MHHGPVPEPVSAATLSISASSCPHHPLHLPAPEKLLDKLLLFLFSVILTAWLSSADKTVKLWKVSERDKRPEGYNLKDEEGRLRDPATITTLRVSGTAALATRVVVGPGAGHLLSDPVGYSCNGRMRAPRRRLNLPQSPVADGGTGEVPSPNDYKSTLFLLSLRTRHMATTIRYHILSLCLLTLSKCLEHLLSSGHRG